MSLVFSIIADFSCISIWNDCVSKEQVGRFFVDSYGSLEARAGLWSLRWALTLAIGANVNGERAASPKLCPHLTPPWVHASIFFPLHPIYFPDFTCIHPSTPNERALQLIHFHQSMVVLFNVGHAPMYITYSFTVEGCPINSSVRYGEEEEAAGACSGAYRTGRQEGQNLHTHTI